MRGVLERDPAVFGSPEGQGLRVAAVMDDEGMDTRQEDDERRQREDEAFGRHRMDLAELQQILNELEKPYRRVLWQKSAR